MFEPLKAFSEGFRYHFRGIRFGFGNPSFLMLSVLPFLVTLALYGVAFYLFTLYADDLLRMIWHVETGESSKYMGWLYQAYLYVVRFIIYPIVLVIMFYTFIVFSNILASPVYDYISNKYERTQYQASSHDRSDGPSPKILTIMKEETKKAMLMLVVPLPLLLIPVIGAILSFIVAAVFLAWDFIDFSLSRDLPLLKDRMKAVWRYKFLFLGFGCPLLIPFFGLMLLPFAILGSTRLYFDRIKP